MGTDGDRSVSRDGDLSTGTSLRLGEELGDLKHGVAFHNAFDCNSGSDRSFDRTLAHCFSTITKGPSSSGEQCAASPAGGCSCATRLACGRPVTGTAFLRFHCGFRCGCDRDSEDACSLVPSTSGNRI